MEGGDSKKRGDSPSGGERLQGEGGHDLADDASATTRIIASKPIEVDGAEFHWWAVGEDPWLVTVKSSIFGSLAEFTYQAPDSFAHKLGRKLLEQHYARAVEARHAAPKAQSPTDPDPMKKPGWFET